MQGGTIIFSQVLWDSNSNSRTVLGSLQCLCPGVEGSHNRQPADGQQTGGKPSLEVGAENQTPIQQMPKASVLALDAAPELHQ